jgi:hypothetical protein
MEMEPRKAVAGFVNYERESFHDKSKDGDGDDMARIF